MPNNFAHQIELISGSGKLNAVNDVAVGGVTSSLTGAAMFGGQLGDRIILDHVGAAQMSDTAVATLYGGIYQYVKTKAASTAAPARGLIAFWDDPVNYVVTPDAPTPNACIAGVYISAPTKGQHCFIQLRGLAAVKFAATITKATPSAQDLVLVKNADNVADVQEDATNMTSALVRQVLGNSKETPTNGGIKLVELWDRFLNV